MAYSTAFSQSISIMAFIEIGSKNEDCDYLSIKIISQKLKIPIPSVKRLTGMLKKQNLLKTKSGIDGGLALIKDPKIITLLDIFLAVEGHSPLFNIYENFDFNSLKKDSTKAKLVLNNQKKMFDCVEQSMIDKLSSITLNKMID